MFEDLYILLGYPSPFTASTVALTYAFALALRASSEDKPGFHPNCRDGNIRVAFTSPVPLTVTV